MSERYYYEENCDLKVKKLSKFACIPTKGSYFSAGFDLHSAHSYMIQPKEQQVCLTDIAIEMPVGSYGKIAPRSGMTTKFFIDVGAGIIDFDYTGNIAVVLFNFGEKPYNVEVGDKIAQLIVHKIFDPKVQEVDIVHTTVRSQPCFGSSGK